MFNRSQREKEYIKKLEQALGDAQEHLNAITKLQADRAILVSIVQDKRVNRFGFIRNGVLTYVETYSTMSDDIPAWKKALLSPLEEKDG